MTHSQGTEANDNIIELSDGVAVRPMKRLDDVKSQSFHANNKKVWNNLRDRIPSPYTEADALWWLEHVQKPESQSRSGRWTREGGAEGPLIRTHFVITVNDESVGSIGLEMGSDVYFRSAELGYWLGEAHWGTGVMSKVVPAFVEWAWKTFGILNRLNGETSEYNKASSALLKKAGFELEGRRPDAVCKNGEFHTTLIWGMLRPKSNA